MFKESTILIRPHSAANINSKRTSNQLLNDISNVQLPKSHSKFISQPTKKVSMKTMTNEFKKIIPRKISLEKERLYSQSLQLKQKCNDITDENIKLKTKLTILQRQNDKIVKNYVQPTIKGGKRIKQRLKLINSNIGDIQNTKKDQSFIISLRNLLTNAKGQIEQLKQQNLRLKQLMKYTSLNELEIERNMIMEENKKLNVLLEQAFNKIKVDQHLQKELSKAKKCIQEQSMSIIVLTGQNQKYTQLIDTLEEQLRETTQKLNDKTNQMKIQTALKNRMQKQHCKQTHELKKQIKQIQQKLSLQIKKKQKTLYLTKKSEQNKELKEKYLHNQQLKSQNERLKIQVEELRKIFNFQRVSEQKNNIQTQVKHQINIRPIQQSKYSSEQSSSQEIYSNQQKQSDQQCPKNQQEKKINPNKEQLKKIKTLLSYRLRAQRYTFNMMKQDILKSGVQKFNWNEIQSMIMAQPFLFNKTDCSTVAKYIFQCNQKDEKITVKTEILMQKFSKIVKKIELIPEYQQQSILNAIADMVCTYSQQLQQQFQSNKNGEGTISITSLREMLLRFGLQQKFLEVIIAQLSLSSESLNKLNYYYFFDRFLLNDELIDNLGKQQQ